ncbi:hypothetical protein AKJ47_00845 [candidate division MSBL1 archaeon SCGC-AAA261G05]|uniref:Uncharacterized protein n=2 Tax=candidate division MSBL1 TaxID=215777 RepID=A0A133V1J4_9EURY|nr:hypothetical protein AKJ42_01095 [candidate division MSBL1 archaeon SCGC-AAA261C02]KXB04075.1 hypothetical protein AKJ47_00845 [candidate division MSBL1 archaeon SCGC-AAA261G05]
MFPVILYTVKGLNPTYVLYGLVLAGSLTFGLEAFLIGFGGRLSTIYQSEKWRLLGVTLLLGLAITITSIGLMLILGLDLI